MPDNPMVGYACQYASQRETDLNVEDVRRWAFVHWATRAFDGFGQCVRYEVRLVLPILDNDGRAFRHLRPYPTMRWAQSKAFKSTITPKAKAKAQRDLEAQIGRVWSGRGLPYP
jgi:hypothetical protein